MNNEELSKLEDILLRYLNFYCNVADIVINELQQKNDNTSTMQSWLLNSKSYAPDALYFELFDHVCSQEKYFSS